MTTPYRLLGEAIQEHMGCACGGIEGHLAVRGITVTESKRVLDYELAVDALETALLYVDYGASFGMTFRGRPAGEVAEEARAALARLRGDA